MRFGLLDLNKFTAHRKIVIMSITWALQRLVNGSQRLGQSVTFSGNVENVHEYLRASDCFVFPTESEAMANSLLEAVASGLPCIASHVGGIPDVVEHNTNGLLVQKGSVEDLTKAIETVLTNSEFAQRLGEEARRTAVEKFEVDKKIDLLESIFASLAGWEKSC